ncbi:MAG TPA: glutathione S-transferase family protein [Thioploca sp.]|nr:glutathione S-transferase family protein [Thioploca sp.]
MKINTNTIRPLLKNNYYAFANIPDSILAESILRTFSLQKGEKIIIGGSSDVADQLCLVKGQIKVEDNTTIIQIDTDNTQPFLFPILPETLSISALDDSVFCHIDSQKLHTTNNVIELELILFAACPYGQRILITLLYNNQPHKLTIIEPGNLPDWFEQVSPLGNVPILRVENETTIFESSVINDYLNQIAANSLLPENPLHRAKCCSWIEFCSTCLGSFIGMISAKTEIAFTEVRDNFLKNLQILEQQVDENGPYFIGEQFTLVDSSYAPLFLRMHHLSEIIDFYKPEELPKIKNWSEKLLALEAVQNSTVGDFSKLFRTFIQKRGQGSYISKLCK